MSEFLGVYLKEARENKGLSIDDIAEETKIQKRYIEALESENFDELPGKTYIKGFLRNYAQVVGLDPAEVIEKYETYNGRNKVVQEDSKNDDIENKTKDKTRIRNVIIAFALLLVFYIIVKLLAGVLPGEIPSQNEENPKVNIEKKVEEIKEVKEEPKKEEVKEVNGENVQIERVEFNNLEIIGKGKSWVEVKDGDSFVFRGYVENETKKEFKSKNILSIKIGDASNVEVIYNGENLGKLGEAKEVVRKTFE